VRQRIFGSARHGGDTTIDPVRVITFTTLFPNAVRPTHGIFVENRLRHLVATGLVTSRVVAPVPWFPRALGSVFPSYVEFADMPTAEIRHDMVVSHPRFPVVPKFGMSLSPATLFVSSLPELRRLRKGSDFDLIDAHYFFPDGVAAVLLGKALGKPVVVTARGTDINSIPNHALPRRMIRYAAREAAGVIAVSKALKDRLVALGVPASKIRILRNGVDLDVFRPSERSVVKARLALKGHTLLSVGNLIELKGHALVIRALLALPEYSLLIAGEGPERLALERLALRLGLADRVRFLGRVAHQRLADIYSAADALVLASSREGWPNVLLEAMACGTPVVASRVGGIPEVVAAPEAGMLMPERTENGVAAAVRALFAHLPDRAATRRYAEKFSWDETTEGQIQLFQEILGRADRPLQASTQERHSTR
jgi:glycosyltransferase involved in cell wall biosynthesis